MKLFQQNIKKLCPILKIHHKSSDLPPKNKSHSANTVQNVIRCNYIPNMKALVPVLIEKEDMSNSQNPPKIK